ncbi:c-type cytochrome [Neobacillus niacini]|uniref:c-type cytochrome n=1 Tax=Neobacillus niacini TaxID=86668 RepID=UPI0039837E9E
MKKFFGIVFFMLLAALLGACGNEEKTASEEPKTEETDGSEDSSGNEDAEPASTSLAGNEVFEKSCMMCHSSGDIAGGQAKIDGAKIHADFKTKEDMLAFVGKNMPQNAPGSLSQDEYQAVVDYLWDQK